MELTQKLKVLIKRLLLRRNNRFVNNKNSIYDKFSDFKLNGNLIIHQNTDVDSLNIHFHEREKDFLNIEIGKDCIIQGNIIMYHKNAKVKIGDRVYIGQNTMIFCYDNIEIMNDTMISWGCTIIDTNAHSLKASERINDITDWKKGWQYKDWSNVESNPIKIGKQAWVGFNSIVMKGVMVGNGGIVASGSVVTKSVDAFTVVGGNPAKFIKNSE